ncbi:MAG TPA: hypothetical protein PLR25_27175 [Planctomycetaceae bacterium]|nr:hypothetical protein [Planctomycetaceae bacterium]
MTSKLNVVYAYSWHLASNDAANVQRIMEAVRAYCIELGCEEVSSLVMKPDSVQFTAVVPNAGQHEFGLTFLPEENAWSANAWVRVSSFKEISEIMHHAASLGIVVRTMFAGMEMSYRKNSMGEIEVEQHSAFDPDTF